MLLIALGSRGDVQPMAALAGALVARGEPVTIVALREFEGMVRAAGADFAAVPASVSEVLAVSRVPLVRRALRSSTAQAVLLRRWVSRLAEPVAEVVTRAAADHEVVLSGILSASATAALSATGRRTATVLYTGQLPTDHPESHLFGQDFTGWRAYDHRAVRVGWRIACALGQPLRVAVERRLGSARAGSQGTGHRPRPEDHPVIVAASPTLVPPAPDWPSVAHQTGTIVAPLAANASLPSYVEDFLAEGAAPVYVGFGSMGEAFTPDDVALVAEAARLCGHRVVTPAVAGTVPGRLADGLLAIGPLPHSLLFPRTSAVVHHGGAGTTFSALAAGVPSVAGPFFGADQPYHGWRLHRLGVGPAPLCVRRLSGPRLAELVIEATSGPEAEGYRKRAAQLGARCRAEDGLGATVRLLEELGYVEFAGVRAAGRPACRPRPPEA